MANKGRLPIMDRIAGILFKLYTVVPYLFFAAFLLQLTIFAIACGGVVVNDHFLESIFLVPLIIASAIGVFLFPVVALTVLLFKRCKWQRLVCPFISYGLYIVSVMFAGHMGWWTD